MAGFDLAIQRLEDVSAVSRQSAMLRIYREACTSLLGETFTMARRLCSYAMLTLGEADLDAGCLEVLCQIGQEALSDVPASRIGHVMVHVARVAAESGRLEEAAAGWPDALAELRRLACMQIHLSPAPTANPASLPAQSATPAPAGSSNDGDLLRACLLIACRYAGLEWEVVDQALSTTPLDRGSTNSWGMPSGDTARWMLLTANPLPMERGRQLGSVESMLLRSIFALYLMPGDHDQVWPSLCQLLMRQAADAGVAIAQRAGFSGIPSEAVRGALLAGALAGALGRPDEARALFRLLALPVQTLSSEWKQRVAMLTQEAKREFSSTRLA